MQQQNACQRVTSSRDTKERTGDRVNYEGHSVEFAAETAQVRQPIFNPSEQILMRLRQFPVGQLQHSLIV